jgi:hypothetical protein
VPELASSDVKAPDDARIIGQPLRNLVDAALGPEQGKAILASCLLSGTAKVLDSSEFE